MPSKKIAILTEASSGFGAALMEELERRLLAEGVTGAVVGAGRPLQ